MVLSPQRSIRRAGLLNLKGLLHDGGYATLPPDQRLPDTHTSED